MDFLESPSYFQDPWIFLEVQFHMLENFPPVLAFFGLKIEQIAEKIKCVLLREIKEIS